MFNGIVQGLGTVGSVQDGSDCRRLSIGWRAGQCRDSRALGALEAGSSVAVNGACLTVISRAGDGVEVELSARTLAQTNLGQLSGGARVNLEAALRMGQSIDGHLLSGHIDGMAQCRLLGKKDGFTRFALLVPPALRKFIVENGALAVDGVSMTVNELTRDGCTITVVPYTCAHTIFQDYPGNKADGAGYRAVNLEVDLLARYVHSSLGGGQITPENPSSGG